MASNVWNCTNHEFLRFNRIVTQNLSHMILKSAVEGSLNLLAESSDGSEDFIYGFGPSVRSGILCRTM